MIYSIDVRAMIAYARGTTMSFEHQ